MIELPSSGAARTPGLRRTVGGGPRRIRPPRPGRTRRADNTRTRPAPGPADRRADRAADSERRRTRRRDTAGRPRRRRTTRSIKTPPGPGRRNDGTTGATRVTITPDDGDNEDRPWCSGGKRLGAPGEAREPGRINPPPTPPPPPVYYWCIQGVSAGTDVVNYDRIRLLAQVEPV